VRDRVFAVLFARAELFRDGLRFVLLPPRRPAAAAFPRFALFFMLRFRGFFMSLLREERQS
jgi:hypothetical protein